MKNQALLSSKDKSKKLKCRLLPFLFGASNVKLFLIMLQDIQQCFIICHVLFFMCFCQINHQFWGRTDLN